MSVFLSEIKDAEESSFNFYFGIKSIIFISIL